MNSVAFCLVASGLLRVALDREEEKVLLSCRGNEKKKKKKKKSIYPQKVF